MVSWRIDPSNRRFKGLFLCFLFLFTCINPFSIFFYRAATTAMNAAPSPALSLPAPLPLVAEETGELYVAEDADSAAALVWLETAEALLAVAAASQCQWSPLEG